MTERERTKEQNDGLEKCEGKNLIKKKAKKLIGKKFNIKKFERELSSRTIFK